MAVFWWMIFGLMFVSYANAQQRGVPWFRWGQSNSRDKNVSSSRLLRTGSIKPKSPYLKPQSRANSQQLLRQKPISSKSSKAKSNKAEASSFYRLNELTHSLELTKRLIDRVQERNPHRNRTWCAEKAIYDLERDRMAR